MASAIREIEAHKLSCLFYTIEFDSNPDESWFCAYDIETGNVHAKIELASKMQYDFIELSMSCKYCLLYNDTGNVCIIDLSDFRIIEEGKYLDSIVFAIVDDLGTITLQDDKKKISRISQNANPYLGSQNYYMIAQNNHGFERLTSQDLKKSNYELVNESDDLILEIPRNGSYVLFAKFYPDLLVISEGRGSFLVISTSTKKLIFVTEPTTNWIYQNVAFNDDYKKLYTFKCNTQTGAEMFLCEFDLNNRTSSEIAHFDICPPAMALSSGGSFLITGERRIRSTNVPQNYIEF